MRTSSVLAVLLFVSACASMPSSIPAAFDATRVRAIDDAVQAAISEGKLPGAVFWLERDGAAYHRAWGRRAIEPSPETMTESTVFDAASITPDVIRQLQTRYGAKFFVTLISSVLTQQRPEVMAYLATQERLPLAGPADAKAWALR